MRRGGVGPVLPGDPAGDLIFFLAFDVQRAGIHPGGLIFEIRAIKEGPVTILIAAQVACEADGIIDVIHVHTGSAFDRDHGGEIGGIAQQHEAGAPDRHFQVIIFFADGPADNGHQYGSQQHEEGAKPTKNGMFIELTKKMSKAP
jgi:hypothetical protein